jgi:branched-chain amino acid transport system permease protein
MGSIPGAFLAAFIISEAKAVCIALGDVSVGGFVFSFSKLTLVVEFIVMAIVLVVRPWGLLGRPQAIQRQPGDIETPPRAVPLRAAAAALALLALLPLVADRYTLVLLIDILAFALFAASLFFMMGPGGMVSFGHAAYFGLGAYGAALLLKRALLPMELSLLLAPVVAGLGAFVFGWFVVRLSGVYLAMLTLAFAQIAWSVIFEWDALTGGSNGLVGIWPAAWLASRSKVEYYWLTLALCGGSVVLLWRMLFSPFGWALRAGRDSPLRADAIGIDVRRQQWLAFALCGAFAGLAGAVYAFSKGSISPDALAIPRSVDALVMVLLGGIHSLMGPVLGAALFTWLQDEVTRRTEFWRAILGLIILALVLAFPGGLAGIARLRRRAV